MVIQSANDCAVQAHPACVTTLTVCVPPALDTSLLVGTSEYEHPTTVVVVTDVVGGGVGSGAPGSDRSIEIFENDISGFDVQF